MREWREGNGALCGGNSVSNNAEMEESRTGLVVEFTLRIPREVARGRLEGQLTPDGRGPDSRLRTLKSIQPAVGTTQSKIL